MSGNPFDWPAGPFLGLYLSIAALIFLFGFSARAAIGPAMQAAHELSVLELAFLAGGARRLGDTALLSLASGGGATIAPKGHKITVTDQAPLATLLGQPASLPVRPDMTRQQFQVAVKSLATRTQERLQALGYYPTDDQMKSFRMMVLPFVAGLLVFGMIKAFVGVERDHPIGFLIVLLVATAFGGFALAKAPARTRAGNDALQIYQDAHARAARAPLDNELLLAVALSGAVVLSGTAYASVYAASQTMSGDGGGDGGGGDGGGGGCGGCS